MPKTIIIGRDEFEDDIEEMENELNEGMKEDFKKMAEETMRDTLRNMHKSRSHEPREPREPHRPEKIFKKKFFMDVDNEVKLFTDKAEMVSYVNQLSDILNVEIFKIEDELYKVLVTRRKKDSECCKDDDKDE